MEGRRRSGTMSRKDALTDVQFREGTWDALDLTSALGHRIPNLVSFVGPFIPEYVRYMTC